jgi:pSer/pThr/pTyr-binding forkhead associated (FHA) protein
VESAAVGWLVGADRELALHEGSYIAGRDQTADVRLESPRVSRRHARIAVRGRRVVIEDLGSKNGTFVNDTRLTGAAPLASGDHVRIGPFTLVFRVDAAPVSTETETTGRRQPRSID